MKKAAPILLILLGLSLLVYGYRVFRGRPSDPLKGLPLVLKPYTPADLEKPEVHELSQHCLVTPSLTENIPEVRKLAYCQCVSFHIVDLVYPQFAPESRNLKGFLGPEGATESVVSTLADLATACKAVVLTD